MSARSLSTLALVVVTVGAAPGAPRAATQVSPRVMTPADHIAACARGPASRRDECLANAAIRSEDVDLCATAKSQGCADLLALVMLPRCARFDGPARFECEIQVATELKSAKACKVSGDPDACLIALAADRRDVTIALSTAKDARQRDMILMQYAVLAKDDTVLSRISDPVLHNKTVAMLAAGMMSKPGFTLTQEWCRRLRPLPANTDRDELHGATEPYCRFAVAMSIGLSRAIDATETDRERAQVLKTFEDALEAMARGSVSIEDLSAAMDPAGVAAARGSFEGAWSCPSRGILTLRIAPDMSVSGTVSGQPGEHWGGDQRRGGSIKGTVTGRSFTLTMVSGDGTESRLGGKFSDDAMSFSGDWTWFRGTIKVDSGTWRCTRVR